MPAGDKLWAYACEVTPQQPSAFAGGVVPLTPQLQAALDSRFDQSKIADGPVVKFQGAIPPPLGRIRYAIRRWRSRSRADRTFKDLARRLGAVPVTGVRDVPADRT